MSLAGQVNNAFYELETLGRAIQTMGLNNPKYQQEIQRLKGVCHRLHFDAVHLDTSIKSCRRNALLDRYISEMHHQIALMRHQTEFVRQDAQRFLLWDRNQPKHSTIFSSPSNSPSSSSSSPGSPAGSSAYSSQSSTNSSQGSQGTRYPNFVFGRK